MSEKVHQLVDRVIILGLAIVALAAIISFVQGCELKSGTPSDQSPAIEIEGAEVGLHLAAYHDDGSVLDLDVGAADIVATPGWHIQTVDAYTSLQLRVGEGVHVVGVAYLDGCVRGSYRSDLFGIEAPIKGCGK